MSVHPALTSTERARLVGQDTIRRFMKAVPLTVIATARVDQVLFGYALAELTVDNTAGWSDVRPGMTVYVGTTSGGHERGIFRVRKPPTATRLYISEMGEGDAGLVPQDIAPYARFENNDYVTILDRYDIWSVLPRIEYPGNAIYEDFDLPVGTRNTTPPPIVTMTINGARGHYGRYISGADHSLTCAVSVTHWTSSSATFAWQYPAAWTGVSGAATDTLTATAEPGDYTVSCTVTPNAGEPVTVTRHIFICDATNNPPIADFALPSSDVRDRQGRRMTFDLYDDALADIPDGAMVHYWEQCTWAGEAVDTATTSFTGWVLRQSRTSGPDTREAQIEVVSPAHLLGMLQGTSQRIEAKASPATWQEVVPALSSASFMAWYMLTWRAANVLRLFDFTVFSTAASGQRLPAWEIDIGTLYDQIVQLATPRGNFGCASDGSLFFLRHPSLLPLAARASVVERDTIDETVYSGVVVEQRLRRMCAQVRGEGFAWDGSAALATPYLSDSPQVPGQGGVPQKLSGQVVDGQLTLNQVTGDYDAHVNNPFPLVQIEILRNRDVYEPAEMAFVEVHVPAALSPGGEAWQKRCIPMSVTKRHNPDGTADILLQLEVETHGLPGVTVPVPVPNTELYIGDGYPPIDLPPIDVNPPIVIEPPVIGNPEGPEMKTDGSVVLACTQEGDIFRTFNFLEAAPDWEEITPSGGAATTFTQVLFDPAVNYSRGAYALGNDGTHTYVYHTSNAGATTVVWDEGVGLPGVYTRLVAFRDSPGAILVYDPETDAGTQTLDHEVTFDAGGDAYTFETVDPSPEAQVLSGGNPGNCGGVESPAQPGNAAITRIRVTLPVPATVTGAALDYKKDYSDSVTYNSPITINFDPPEANYEIVYGQRLSSGGRTTAGVMNGTNSGTYREVNLKIPVYVPSGVSLKVVFYCKGTQNDPGIFRMATTWAAYDANDNDLGIGLGANNSYLKDTWVAFGQLYNPTTPAAVAYVVVRVWVSTQGYYSVAYCYMDDVVITATGAYQQTNIQLVRRVQLLDPADGVIATVIDQSSQPTNATWFTDSVSSLSHSNVKSALFTVSASSSPNALKTYLDNATLTGSYSAAGKAQVALSTNYGASFSTPVIAGDTPSGVGGFDAARFGPASFAAALSQVKRATTLGGAYSNLTGGAVTARSIVVPWWRVGSISATNYGTDADILIGGSFGLQSVVGGSATDITPAAGGTVAVANAITMWKGRRIACLLDESGNRNLYVTTDTGASWTLVGGMNGAADARSVRVRRLANTPGQLVVAAGSNGIKYYPGSGTSLVDKGAPSGTFMSAEFFG